MRRFLQDFTKNELEDLIKPKFRAKQIFSWLYNKYVTSYDDMRNIPKVLKEELSKKYSIEPLRILNVEESIDGSKKYLFELDDGNSGEAGLALMERKREFPRWPPKTSGQKYPAGKPPKWRKFGGAFGLNRPEGGFFGNLRGRGKLGNRLGF